MISDKKLFLIFDEITKETPRFGINDVCLFFNLPRNSAGRETLDVEFGINARRIGCLIAKSDKYEKCEALSSSNVRWQRRNK